MCFFFYIFASEISFGNEKDLNTQLSSSPFPFYLPEKSAEWPCQNQPDPFDQTDKPDKPDQGIKCGRDNYFYVAILVNKIIAKTKSQLGMFSLLNPFVYTTN